jgi:winged helix-turn-helix DNA-binding protein
LETLLPAYANCTALPKGLGFSATGGNAGQLSDRAVSRPLPNIDRAMMTRMISLVPSRIWCISALHLNGRLTINDLAEKVGLSLSPCWTRVKRMEADGTKVMRR